MFGGHYFAKRYFAGRYFPPKSGGGTTPPPDTGTGTKYGYFPHKYFGKRYFANRYYPGAGGSGSTPPPTETEDTNDLTRKQYRSHRRKLERAARAAERYEQSKYVKEAVKIAEIAIDYSINAPEVVELANLVASKQPVIDIKFDKVHAEISRIMRHLDTLVEMQELEREQERELILLMGLM